MKPSIFFLILIIPIVAKATDTTQVVYQDLSWDDYNSDGIPIDADGDPIDFLEMKILDDASTYINGWMYNAYEWDLLKHGWASEPEYDNNPAHGINIGYSRA